MNTSRRAFGLGVAALATGLSLGAQAADPEHTFSIHHFLSPKALNHAQMIEPWAKSIEEASGGRIAFEIFPSMSLGGKPPELYSQVRDGVVDIVWTLPGYTPGVFPRVEVFELSDVHGGSALATNLAIQDLMGDLAEDFTDVHPLLVHVHSGNALHLTQTDVKGVDDVKGLKLRSPSRTGAWMLDSWGAEPVGMPVPALPQALAKNTVDGALVPFEIAIPLKLAELTDHSVEMKDGERFGTSTFLFAMNKDSYDSLPDDLKKIVDDHSGGTLAKTAGEAWDSIEPLGKKVATDAGKTVTQLSDEATAEFKALESSVSDTWKKEVSELGIDGEALYDKAKAAVEAHTN
ncbi:MAG: TRAP transporter substrate-binding protein [Pseudomonadota bacterium]